MKHRLIQRVALGALLPVSASGSCSDLIDYPHGYRMWTHVKSMTIEKGHPLENPFLGIHHVYANGRALDGLRRGQFEDGSVLIFDQLQSRDAGHASTEGERVLIGVMIKDSPRFPDTDGWGYEAWADGDRSRRLVSDGGASCHACHAQQKDRDFVFSKWRE